MENEIEPKITRFCIENDMKPDSEIFDMIERKQIPATNIYLTQILQVMLDIRKLLIMNKLEE